MAVTGEAIDGNSMDVPKTGAFFQLFYLGEPKPAGYVPVEDRVIAVTPVAIINHSHRFMTFLKYLNHHLNQI